MAEQLFGVSSAEPVQQGANHMGQTARTLQAVEAPAERPNLSVYSCHRDLRSPEFQLPTGIELNTRLKMDGIHFLENLPEDAVPVAFFDPQYRGVLDKLGYGNEGQSRGRERCALEQMSEKLIGKFIRHISATLIPSGHLFLWMDKFHLCTGFTSWLDGTPLEVVDMITWDKSRIGMGYRTRRTAEYLVVLQKKPRKAKGVWKVHTIPDVWQEKVQRKSHTHNKPVELQAVLIEAVSNVGDVVIDPAAGSFSVMEACLLRGRNFLGCDLNG